MRKVVLLFSCLVFFLSLTTVTWATTITMGSSKDTGVLGVYFSPSSANINYGTSEWLHHYSNNPTGSYLKQDAFT